MAKKKQKTKKHPGGRPTKYKPEYCKAIIKFFSIPPNRKEVMEVSTSQGVSAKGGTSDFRKEKYQLVPNDPPFFEDFATSIGVSDDTIVNWAKRYPEFLAAYNKAKFLQKRFLIINGLAGCYPPASYIFTAKNITDMRDKQEVDTTKTFDITGLEKLEDNELDELIKALQNRAGNSIN
jgi:hypothetical protein